MRRTKRSNGVEGRRKRRMDVEGGGGEGVEGKVGWRKRKRKIEVG